MDRDLILAGLMVTGVGVTLLAAGHWPRALESPASARRWERAAWRGLWWPMAPAIVVASVLTGWAIMEPAQSDEHLPSSVVFVSALFVVLWLRASIRASVSLREQRPEVAGTVGLWRPQIIVSDALLARIDPPALEAILAHEAAHVRHHDPLRIWLAQVVTDLQWPFPAARRRFNRWRHVLELARDEEARRSGVDGADLAAGIVVAARLHTGCSAGATLIDNRDDIEARITRLLAPLPADEAPMAMTTPLTLLPASLLGLLSGVRFGEVLVQSLVKWLP